MPTALDDQRSTSQSNTQERASLENDAPSSGKSPSRRQRVDMGRAEWSHKAGDRRARNGENLGRSKRQKTAHDDDDNSEIRRPVYAVEFSREEIKADDRRPKRKVAVFIGYSGTGYKGMQLNDKEKTIEGDLFQAFIRAGAISKANANDPKKSALVRCARTDKGVHAVGNLISLKLIIEDADIVHKINAHLTTQIRVWGIVRTIGSFSAYQFCDSRIYEYLIPSYCFLCPHPESFLGRRLKELADEAGDADGYQSRQRDVSKFWPNIEEIHIGPILNRCDPSVRSLLVERLRNANHWQFLATTKSSDEEALDVAGAREPIEIIESAKQIVRTRLPLAASTFMTHDNVQIEATMKELRAAYLNAKKAYRIHPDRLARLKSALTQFVGTHNFHNYTIHKDYNDASAKRVIKSFSVSETPMLINGTEWLSLKIHGQSFMMHQIRKMVSMVALLVRCGCREEWLNESFKAEKIVIPKAPSSGLLLEQPVFESHNARLSGQEDRQPISFTPYAKDMETFKQHEIYERIFREEERDNQFHALFTGYDHLESSQLLYLSSKGIIAIHNPVASELASIEVDAASASEESKTELY